LSRQIDSGALRYVGGSLGISGFAPQHIDLMDDSVQQTFDMGQIARRGLADISNAGLGVGVLRNIHTDAETLGSSVDVYNVATGAIKWPVPVSDDFDIWLLAAGLHRTSGAGTVNAGLSLNYGLQMDVFGVDDSGAAVTGFSDVITLAWWDTLITAGDTFGVRGAAGAPNERIGFRIPRSTPASLLQFTSTSSLTVTFDCQLLLGLFPVALGQDGIT